MNTPNKTRSDVTRTMQGNQALGIKTERELELMRSQAEQYTATHAGMVHNGTADLDQSIQRVREEVKQNVHRVLEEQKAQSEQVQGKQLDTAHTSQAVRDIIGNHQHQHQAIKAAFEDEAPFHERLKEPEKPNDQVMHLVSLIDTEGEPPEPAGPSLD